ncbi:MAG: glycosyl transferase group 1 [Actinomycetia bacterium]|nr:glycosyl transferase group 1 [Actinomycetes bacterium]
MKISMISVSVGPLPTPGGHCAQSIHVAELARELGAQGHQVTIHTRRSDPGQRNRSTFAPGVTVEHVMAGPARPLSAEELLPHLAAFGQHLATRWAKATPDVVHAQDWTSGLAALSGANDLAIPVVQTYHSLGLVEQMHTSTAGPAPRIRLEKALGRTVDAIIAGCADEKEDMVAMGMPRPRISVVPAGLDVEEFTEQGPAYPRGDRQRLLMLSGPDESKGVRTAISMLAWIPGAELVIAGGPQREDLAIDPGVHELRMLAKEVGVADRVIFLGRVTRKNVPRLLRSADLVLSLPSYEPYGLVPLEAMACGIPVVATAVGGHLDTVIDGVTGLLVQPGRPVELARRIRRLLAEPTELEALGIAAADRVRSRHAWPRVTRETVAVYHRVAQLEELEATA